MGNLNKVILLGRITKNPQVNEIGKDNTSAVNFSIATNEFFKDDNDEWDSRPEYHFCSAYGRIADTVGDYVKKGDQLMVEGSLQTVEWEDDDGDDHRTTKIKVKNLQLIESKRDDDDQPAKKKKSKSSGKNKKSSKKKRPAQDDDDFIEDDIPF